MTNGLTDEAIAAYAADLLEIEAAIEQGQDDKKAVYANLRETYGKRAADSLKLAIKRHRMDADKRTEADEIDAEAERFLSIIRKPSAPRATRTREIIEEFDPETGEIKSTQHQPRESTGAVHTKVAVDANAGGENVAAPGSNDREKPSAEMGNGPGESAGSVDFDGKSRDGGLAPISDVELVAPHYKPAEGNTPTSAGRGDRGAVVPSAAPVVASNVVEMPKRITFSDKPHSDCLDPERCGGFSNLKLCQRCTEAAAGGQVA